MSWTTCLDVTLVVLQSILLYRIARLAQELRGDRIIAAAKLVKARLEARSSACSHQAIRLDDLTDCQRATLERLRGEYLREEGELDDLWEPFLLRHLVHCDWNEAEAVAKLRRTATWRNEHGAAAIRRKLAEGRSVMQHDGVRRLLRSIGFAIMHRRSLSGDVLTIVDVGSLDLDAWCEQLSDAEFAEVALQLLESVSHHADALSYRERTLVRQAFVFDYEALRWVHLSPRIFRRLYPHLKSLEAYYPEQVGSVLCVHASPLFVHLWGVLAPWLSPALRQRISIVSSEHTRAALMGVAPPSNLPTAFGGTCATLPEDVCQLVGWSTAASDGKAAWPPSGKLAGYWSSPQS